MNMIWVGSNTVEFPTITQSIQGRIIRQEGSSSQKVAFLDMSVKTAFYCKIKVNVPELAASNEAQPLKLTVIQGRGSIDADSVKISIQQIQNLRLTATFFKESPPKTPWDMDPDIEEIPPRTPWDMDSDIEVLTGKPSISKIKREVRVKLPEFLIRTQTYSLVLKEEESEITATLTLK